MSDHILSPLYSNLIGLALLGVALLAACVVFSYKNPGWRYRGHERRTQGFLLFALFGIELSVLAIVWGYDEYRYHECVTTYSSNQLVNSDSPEEGCKKLLAASDD